MRALPLYDVLPLLRLRFPTAMVFVSRVIPTSLSAYHIACDARHATARLACTFTSPTSPDPIPHPTPLFPLRLSLAPASACAAEAIACLHARHSQACPQRVTRSFARYQEYPLCWSARGSGHEAAGRGEGGRREGEERAGEYDGNVEKGSRRGVGEHKNR